MNGAIWCILGVNFAPLVYPRDIAVAPRSQPYIKLTIVPKNAVLNIVDASLMFMVDMDDLGQGAPAGGRT